MSKNRKNVWIIVGVVMVVIVAAVLFIASLRGQNSSAANYQTTTVQRGTLTSVVEGSGTVAAIQAANLTWQTSGQVEKVNVQAGDQVHKGDILAYLAQSSLSPTILSAQLDLANAQQSLNSLLHPDVATLASAQTALGTAYKNYNTASYNLYNALYNNQSYGDVAHYDVLVAKWTVMNNALASAVLPAASTEVQSYYWAARASELGQTDMDYASIKASLLAKLDPTVAQNMDALVTAQADYETAVNNFVASITSSTSAINVHNSLASYFTAVANEAAAQEKMYTLAITPDPAQVAAAQAKVDAAQATLNQAQITAPFDGTITQVSVNPGDVVSNNTKAFRVDNLSQMVVTVQVVEIDVNSVKADQPATVTFDAIPNKIYNGKLLRADLAGTAGQNSINFNVTVELTDADSQIKPGMAANVSITTNQVDNALLVPSTAIFTDGNNQQYVYLIQNGSPTVVNVKVGAVSSSTSQITSDTLKEGDTIVLSFASATSSNGGGFGFGGIGGGVVRTGGTGNVQGNP
jgi:HlyD family secretion protein